MATTTPNFGWSVPTSSDLVKNGATAIETLGDSIDASLLDLKGGTTGQLLSKTSNTDMDFTWTTPSAGGGGKVLQVVTANNGTAVINSTTTFADTGLSATITPAASSSKILVFVSHTDSYRTGTDSGLKLRLLRGATEVATNGTTGDEQTSSSGTVIFTTTLMYLDSPSTTSATTYKTQLANFTAAASVRVNFNSTAGTSQIVLMEIGV